MAEKAAPQRRLLRGLLARGEFSKEESGTDALDDGQPSEVPDMQFVDDILEV
jgi:hypothetical protein